METIGFDKKNNGNLPGISVIIPTYNRSRLLLKAIESVRKQTHQNIEIIVVDDCSIDDTEQIVRNIQDERIRYIKHETNKGGAESRNTGIKNAAGAYIGFLDSDDQWLPEKLEKQLNIFKLNSKIGVVYTGIATFNEEGFLDEILPQYRGKMISYLLEANYINTTSSILVEKNLLDQVNGFNSTLPSCQDWDLYLKLAQKTSFDFVGEPLVLFYQHKGERISTNNQAVLEGHLYIYRHYKKLAEKQGEKVFMRFNFNVAKTIFKTGVAVNDKKTIKIARGLLAEGLSVRFSTIGSLILYFASFGNVKLLKSIHEHSPKKYLRKSPKKTYWKKLTEEDIK